MADVTKEAAVTEFDVLREHEGDRFYRTGETREANAGDVAHLVKSGVLRPRGKTELRQDGPTIDEFLTAGYPAANYPPQGYASRSTPEEIATAVAARSAPTSSDIVTEANSVGAANATPTVTETEPMAATEKAAQAPDNKAAPKPDNKAAPKPSNKSAS